MIIYESTKAGFLDSVMNDRIAKEVSKIYKERIGKPNEKEISAWNDSMQYMFKVLSSDDRNREMFKEKIMHSFGRS